MDITSLIKIISMFLLIDIIKATDESNDTNSLEYESESSNKLLSRKRRYIIFPDGSSVQLVFCEQNHGYLQLGDIVWFGITAALAWELPTDPNIYYHILKAEKGKIYGPDDGHNRRQDSKHLVYLDEDGKVLSMVPYKRRKFLVNPAMAKRSVDSITESETIKKLSRKDLHELQKSKRLLQDLEEVSADFHREGRKDFYAKLETLFEQFGWSGKDCILRFICESAQRKKKQGTFVQEIVRATFTFPNKGRLKESHEIYEKAHSTKGECIKLYPECEADLLFQ